ncbi:MAG: amino acid decarboxylase [Oscillospiraceae bacterium]|nr:amino acid decarboxylase [Oscillospiraceae bacterium]
MKTPIHDFVTRYRDLRPARFHMPGHKGRGPLGCEELDITEIPGADSLYEAAGIIAQSEANASALFGCPTFYSTEGSSHCIRAMLLLAMQIQSVGGGVPDAPNVSDPGSCGASRTPPPTRNAGRFRVLAARNVHRAFLSAAALLDLEVCWLPAAAGSYLSADVTPEALDRALTETDASAVYLTCPDYLGNLPDLKPLAEICHAHGALLLVDNAHGAYLRFLKPSRHPMDLGADLCCDSAHKTLPVLTGGAYLHVKGTGNREQGTEDGGDGSLASLGMTEQARFAVRDALALFGSTSPSYLILQSLDLANPFLERLPALLETRIPRLEALKRELTAAGCRLYGQEPLKLTLDLRETGRRGTDLAAALEQEGVYCEFADPDFVVFMLTPHTTDEELERLRRALVGAAIGRRQEAAGIRFDVGTSLACPPTSDTHPCGMPETVCSLRQAMLSPCERIPAEQSLGRILARPGVSCPPAVPILMPGERIDEEALAAFRYYGIKTCDVLME